MNQLTNDTLLRNACKFNGFLVPALLLAVVTASSAGCGSSPASQFGRVMAGIKKRAAQTREYIKVSRGTYTGGPHTGEKYESFSKTKWQWEVLGRDIRKTDSVTTPYTATVSYKVKEQRSVNNPNDWQQSWRTFDSAKQAKYESEVVTVTRTARFVFEDGEWKCLAEDASFPVVDKPTYEDSNPASYTRLR